jgi:hypothetical protein
MDEEVQRAVWNSRIAVCVRLAENEADLLETMILESGSMNEEQEVNASPTLSDDVLPTLRPMAIEDEECGLRV